MRTNNVIDDNLLKEAFTVSQARTKKDLTHEALRELIRLRKRKDLTELAGAIELKILLLHRDEDFERIALIRPLAIERFPSK